MAPAVDFHLRTPTLYTNPVAACSAIREQFITSFGGNLPCRNMQRLVSLPRIGSIGNITSRQATAS